MKYFMDTINIEEIKEAMKYFNIQGVTTNPKILYENNMEFEDVVIFSEENKIQVFIQFLDIESLNKAIDKLTYIPLTQNKIIFKLPLNKEGLYAIKNLKHKNCPENLEFSGTTSYNIFQINEAIEQNFNYTMVYYNKNPNKNLINEAVKLKERTGSSIKLIAASIHTPDDLYDIINSGIEYATVKPQVLFDCLNNSLVNKEIKQLKGFIK